MTAFKAWSYRLYSLALALLVAFAAIPALAQSILEEAIRNPRIRPHNPGPDPRTEMGRQFLDILASNPDFGWVSMQLIGEQKFRTQDGLIIGRQLFGENETKAIVWGQDGTHGAKVAGQSAAGASFGASAQGIMNHLGLDSSLAFSNQFLTTIYGQYGTEGAPYVEINADGKPEIKFAKIVNNGLFILANHPKSPIAMARSAGLDWNLRQNRDSLKLMVMLGGAAKDGMGSWLEAKGVPVETKYTEGDFSRMHQALWESVSAGSNKEFAVPLNAEGKDIYEILLGRGKLDYSNAKVQKAAQAALLSDIPRAMSMMVFPGGGINGSGFVHRAQLGGFRLAQKYVDKDGVSKMKAISIKGVMLSDKTVVKNDVLIADFPHPTAIGMMKTEAERVEMMTSKVMVLDYYRDHAGWYVEADPGFENKYAKGLPLDWKGTKDKARIPMEHFEFGIPGIRSTHETDASRLSVRGLDKGNHIAAVSLSGRVSFDNTQIATAYNTPVTLTDAQDILTTRARGQERYVFDRGPSQRFKDLFDSMKTPEMLTYLFALKPDMTLEKDGVAAVRTGSHPDLLVYAPYRGNLETPKVMILSDRVWGFDDSMTSMAQVGARGQHYQGLMNDLGVMNDYVVFDTVPVSMEGKSQADWSYVLEPTQEYREKVITEILRNNTVGAILTDGEQAAKEMRRIAKKLGIKTTIVDIKSTGSGDRSQGIVEAGRELSKKVPAFKGRVASGKPVDIPRAHLNFWADRYVGTGGVDRVVNANDVHAGRAFARVVPRDAFYQKSPVSFMDGNNITELRKIVADSGFRWMNEEVPAALERMKSANPKFEPSLLKKLGPTSDIPAKTAPAAGGVMCHQIFGAAG